ncbi:MAG: hypothetical protein ACRDTJ_19775, partial [Pseudonocardiaceae bacterium]
MPDTPARSTTWSWFGESTRTDDTDEIPPTSEAVDSDPDPRASQETPVATTQETPPSPPWDGSEDEDHGKRGGALRRTGITAAVLLGL